MTDLLRSALWQLYQNLKTTVTCVVSLAVGIAIVCSTASIVDHALLQPLPFHQPEKLVVLRSQNVAESKLDQQVSLIDLDDWEQDCTTMEMTAFWLARIDLPTDGNYKRMLGLYVSPSFFDVMQIRPFLGVDFRDYETDGHWKQIMVSPEIWREQLHERPEAIGNIIEINSWASYPNPGSLSFQLTGLLPEGMRCVPARSDFVDDHGLGINRPLDFVLPLNMSRGNYQYRRFRDMDAIGRLNANVSLEQAQAEMDLICARLAQRYPESNKGWNVRVVPLREHISGDIRPFVMATWGAACLVFLISIANVVHMLLVQYQKRQSEMAIRAAVGASPLLLIGQVFLEFSLIMATGLALGIWAANFCTPALMQMAPGRLRWLPTALSLNAVVFAIVSCVVAGLFVWWLALRRVLSPNLSHLLGANGRTSSADQSSVRTLRRMSQLQLVATYALMIGAGVLWLRTSQLADVDPGFIASDRLAMSLSLPAAKYEWDHNSVFNQAVAERVRDVPGVVDAAVILGMPMGNSQLIAEIVVEGRPLIRPGDLPTAYVRVISDTYFETMGIPLVAGRKFNSSDSIGEVGFNRTAIVSKTMVDRCWPGVDPIGRRFKPYAEAHWMEVVGIVGNVHSGGVDKGPAIDIYYPEKLYPQSSPTLVVHTATEPMSQFGRIRDVILDVDEDAHVTDVKTMENVIIESQAERYFGLRLLSVLSIIGFGLAVLGIVATTSYSITRRSGELMVHVACGANPLDILRLVVGEQASVVGVALGGAIVLGLFLAPSIGLGWSDLRFYRQLALFYVPLVLGMAAIVASLLIAMKFAFGNVRESS